MKKEESKGKNMRLVIFGVIVAIIVIVTIVIIIITNVNKGKEIEESLEQEEIKTPVNTINPDAKPEDGPTIAGVENVEMVNGTKVNKSSKITSDRSFGNYKFTNIKLKATKSGTIMTTKVSSTETEKTKGKIITIKFYDKEGKFVSQLNSYIGQIKPGEEIDFRAESTSDLSNAYDMVIE